MSSARLTQRRVDTLKPCRQTYDVRDPNLKGFSEGGIATATVTGAVVNARVIEGWTCHSGWSRYRGLAASPSEPVLALVGGDDPWFRPACLHGDCGVFMDGRNGRISSLPGTIFHGIPMFRN